MHYITSAWTMKAKIKLIKIFNGGLKCAKFVLMFVEFEARESKGACLLRAES